MTEVKGRGGRVIVVDERRAASLNTTVNQLPHTREVPLAKPADERDWSDRILDAVSDKGLYVLGGVVVLLVAALAVVGVLRLFGVIVIGGAS